MGIYPANNAAAMKKVVVILLLIVVVEVIAIAPLIRKGPYEHRHDWCGGANTCVNNLRFLDGAKQQWFLEEHKGTNDVPTMADLAPYMGNQVRNSYTSCPLGGVYSLGKVCESPTCNLKGHQLP
jgi:hypothetical protein